MRLFKDGAGSQTKTRASRKEPGKNGLLTGNRSRHTLVKTLNLQVAHADSEFCTSKCYIAGLKAQHKNGRVLRSAEELGTHPLFADDLLRAIDHALVWRRLPRHNLHGLDSHFQGIQRMADHHLYDQSKLQLRSAAGCSKAEQEVATGSR